MKTARTSQLPPFYTHGIGSLPRPQVVRDLLANKRTMPADDFAKTMDDLVIFAIRLQEQAGLDVVSDGEWRRSQYIREFLDRIGGFERCRKFSHQGETKLTDVVVRRMTANESVFRDDAHFLRSHTNRATKFALPSPFLIAVRYWHEDYSRDAYPSVQHFLDHLADVLAREARALVEAGIDIVQLDDPALTYFCDRRLTDGAGADIHDERLRRTWDVDRQFPEALAAINRVAEGLRAEVHLHCCHSVYKRRSDVTGDYKPILPRLCDAKVDRVNLEFAYPGTGDVSDLALLPAQLGLGMGVIDVRSEHLQTVEQIEALGEAGTRIVGPDRIALNPDCGFAPDASEPPTIDEAYENLRRLVAAATRLRQRFANRCTHLTGYSQIDGSGGGLMLLYEERKSSAIQSVRFSPDGACLAAATQSDQVRWFEVGERITPRGGLVTGIEMVDIAFSGTGETLAVIGRARGVGSAIPESELTVLIAAPFGTVPGARHRLPLEIDGQMAAELFSVPTVLPSPLRSYPLLVVTVDGVIGINLRDGTARYRRQRR